MSGALARFHLFRGLGLTWIYVPFQWFYLRAHGLSATELMGLNTVFCVTAVLLEVPTGALADRVGRKAVLVAGAAASSLSCVAFVALPGSLVGLALANVLAALAMTCISGADSAYLFDLVDGRRRPGLYQQVEATSSALRLAASALGGLAGFAVVSRGGSLSGLYLLTAGLTACAALVGATLPERRPERRPSLRSLSATLAPELVGHARRASRVVLERRDLVTLLLVSAVLFPVLRVGLFLDQPYLGQLGFATATVGLAFAAKDLVAALAAWATARLLPSFGARRLFLVLPLVAGTALLAMGLASHSGAAALVLLPTAAFGVYSPLVRVYVNGMAPADRDRATVLSIEGMARRLGFAAFSPIVGAVFDLWSLEDALMVSSAWAAVALGLAWRLPATRRSGGGERSGRASRERGGEPSAAGGAPAGAGAVASAPLPARGEARLAGPGAGPLGSSRAA